MLAPPKTGVPVLNGTASETRERAGDLMHSAAYDVVERGERVLEEGCGIRTQGVSAEISVCFLFFCDVFESIFEPHIAKPIDFWLDIRRTKQKKVGS